MSESHIRTKNEFLRNPEYIEFDKKVKSTVYCFLQAAIVRESKQVKNYTYGAKYIYNEHFLKGRLVSRYSLKNIAKYLQTSPSSIHRSLKELEQDGFIKIIRTKTSFAMLCYYQLGNWSGTPGKKDYQELIWHDEIFSELIIDQRKKKEEKALNEKKRREAKFEGVYNDYDRAV